VRKQSIPTRPQVQKLQDNIEHVLKGKSAVVRDAIICILARGHMLIEDVPGVGKTTLAQCIARSINLSFSRIQFTSDLLPSDILGVTIYNQDTHLFEFKPGPLFAHVVLADEINRSTPKTQSALLEAMNSAEVTAEKQTFQLPKPFMVLATQNPIEFHGTFPLPKSQMDRFMMRLHLGYPDLENEVTVLREQRLVGNLDAVQAVISAEEMLKMQHDVDNVRIDDSLLQYLARIVAATRTHPQVMLGASTRGALSLRRAAQARAYMEDRDYCVPDDIKSMVVPVLSHRVQIQTGFELNGFTHERERDLLSQITESIEVPL